MQHISPLKFLADTDFSRLQELPTFGAISQESIQWLIENGQLYSLRDGEALFSPGDPGNRFYVILSGAFAYIKEHRGQSAYIRDYSFGEQLGFMSMIALHNRVGAAVAIGNCQVLEVCDALFHQLHEEAPVDFGILMINLSREMARTLRTVDNLMVCQLCELESKHDAS